MVTALKGQGQAAKDEFKILLNEARPSNAKDIAFKIKVAANAAQALQLEERATTAERKAKAFLAKSEAAEDQTNRFRTVSDTGTA